MKLPEYLISTPRLIAVLLTLGTMYLAFTGQMDVKDYSGLCALAFGYFFGSRGKEERSKDDDKTLVN